MMGQRLLIYLDRKRGGGGGNASSVIVEPTIRRCIVSMTIYKKEMLTVQRWIDAGGRGPVLASTMSRTQNRAVKGSTVNYDETLCPSGYDYSMVLWLTWCSRAARILL